MSEGSNDPEFTSLRQGTTDPRAVEAYYDDWADGYDDTLQSWQYRAPEDAATLLGPYLSSGTQVLDVGCGTGLLGRALRERANVRMHGLDISSASIEQAAARGIYEQLLQHDLQDVPLPVANDGYDVAASVGVLTYIADAETLLRDLCRAVRNGGAVAFTQRSDLWEARDFDRVVAGMEADGLWEPKHISEPMPYLPGNLEFADDIRVIHTLCQVQ
jgi:predicted TPR repeat methyltransferase